jgi:hypothetical protein
MDRVELIAQELHDGWWEFKLAEGTSLGPRNLKGKHPHMVPWESLGDESRNQDRFQASLLLHNWLATGKEVKPEEIHQAWVLWEQLNESNHPHAKDYATAHGEGPGEHKFQAARVNELLRKWRSALSNPSKR